MVDKTKLRRVHELSHNLIDYNATIPKCSIHGPSNKPSRAFKEPNLRTLHSHTATLIDIQNTFKSLLRTKLKNSFTVIYGKNNSMTRDVWIAWGATPPPPPCTTRPCHFWQKALLKALMVWLPHVGRCRERSMVTLTCYFQIVCHFFVKKNQSCHFCLCMGTKAPFCKSRTPRWKVETSTKQKWANQRSSNQN